jgi:hypothetical protein
VGSSPIASTEKCCSTTISANTLAIHEAASDPGYLLRKNPERFRSFEVFGGVAHVFYPVATENRCTVALFLEVDPIDLVRRQG